jgi:hypothetical protein
MNTYDISRILTANSPLFRGVFSCDTLPTTRVRGLIVCNTDPHDKPGQHWIAMYFDDDRGEYFDSFGRAPTRVFKDYLNRHCKCWIYNDRQLQSVCSRFCGHYCVYYCLLRGRGVDLRRIVATFTNDTGFNDVIVHRFICSK